MAIQIVIPEPLRRYSQGLVSIEVSGRDLGQVLESLFRRLPELRPRLIDARGRIHPYLILLRDREELPREGFAAIEIADGETLDIVPLVEGGSGADDVRMKGFRSRMALESARALAFAGAETTAEIIDLADAAGRVLARPIVSRFDLPPFDRAAMDGHAIRAEDSFQTRPLDPARLRVVGEVLPGSADRPRVGAGEACRIMTGARLPEGADAVLPAEESQEYADGSGAIWLRVEAAVAPRKNVGARGEDVRCGETILAAGRRLRPQDLGLLSALGEGRLDVVRAPRVAILVTGDELLPAGSVPVENRIVDANTPMLRALIERDGGRLIDARHHRDDREAIRAHLRQVECDVLLTAGGSSVGREDHLPTLVAELGALEVHGVAMRPAAPAGYGRIDGKRVFLLPGNPVSCLAAYDLLAGPLIRLLAGRPRALELPHAVRRLPLHRRIASQIGRLDYVRVRVEEGRVTPLAARGAAILSSTTRSDGFVLVPEDSEGFDEGVPVDVYFYDDENGNLP